MSATSRRNKKRGKKAKPKNTGPKCPKCERRTPAQEGATIFWCEHCQMQFDADPDEGGDYSDRNPAARLERAERRRR